jgi:copper oxidase (laccase) domain-containing protein
VGSDVREAFIQAFKGTGVDVSACFLARTGKASRQSTGQVQGVRGISQPSELAQNKWLANLPELAKARLRLLGIDQILGNNGQDAWCTVRSEDLFFSHRRDKVSGRQAALIWLTDPTF